MIRELCKVIDREYVSRCGPHDKETWSRWESDGCAKLRERYRVAQLQDEHYPLLEAALQEWRKSEAIMLEIYADVRNWAREEKATKWLETVHPQEIRNFEYEFEEWFSGVRNGYLRSNLSVPVYSGIRGIFRNARGLVCNIGQCQTFAAFLPLAVPHQRLQLARTGLRMASVFYLGHIDKFLDRLDQSGKPPQQPYGLGFANVDACWQRAGELLENRRAKPV